MLQITREMCRKAHVTPIRWGMPLLQAGMGRCPWRTAVASMLCNRTSRVVAEPALRMLFALWPTAGDLARANGWLVELCIAKLGIRGARTRARRLTRFSSLYTGDAWHDLRELPGVGAYVNDAVGLCCFGCTELCCEDHALTAYVKETLCAQSSR